MTDEQPIASKPAERSIWSLSRDEQRLLWITFAGGLGSILAGVILVGGAIAFDRYFNYGKPVPSGVLVFDCVMTLSFVALMIAGARRGQRGRLVVYGFGFAYCMLLWLGLAAGIH